MWLGWLGFGLVVLSSVMDGSPALAHPGGLDASGCHHDRKHGGYHCHSGATPQRHDTLIGGSASRQSFRNCTAARSAGAAPVRIGDRGSVPIGGESCWGGVWQSG